MFERIKALKSKLFADITTIPKILQPTHLTGLDGLRGIAIILVILSHVFMNSPYTKSFIGAIGVWTFFVISGFLITTLLLKEKVETGGIALKKFYLRRVFRILPVAYLFLIVLAILNYYQHLGIKPMSFTSAALFIQNIPGFYNWYVEHYWSLSVEEQFYLVFPFLLAYDVNKYLKVIIFLIIAVPVIEYVGFNYPGMSQIHVLHVIIFVIINLLGNSVFILIGSLMSILLFKGFIIIKDSIFTRALSLILFITVILIRTDSSLLFINYSELYIVPFLTAFIIILNLNPKSFFNYLLGSRILIYLGALSYSLYIWQQLFDNQNTWIIKSNSVLLHLVMLFIVANASYYLYERFFLRMKKRFIVKLK